MVRQVITKQPESELAVSVFAIVYDLRGIFDNEPLSIEGIDLGIKPKKKSAEELGRIELLGKFIQEAIQTINEKTDEEVEAMLTDVTVSRPTIF